MEFKSNMSDMQSDPFKKYIKPKAFAPRRGQRKLLNLAATTEGDQLTAVFPTGYGKSKVALGTYGILRARKIVDRCLIIVPTDLLRNQFDENSQSDCKALGFEITSALSITKEDSNLRYTWENRAEIFICTYAQILNDKTFWISLFAENKWLVVRDECHRLREDKEWGKKTAELGGNFILNLTATPVRSDGARSVAVPSVTSDDGLMQVQADVVVTVKEAIQEQALRMPVAHVEHYFVDVMMKDGRIERIDTERFKDDKVLDDEGNLIEFDKYEAQKGLRYCNKYLSKILIDAIQVLEFKNIRYESQNQMLVFAMTCRHAEAVSQQLNAICGAGFSDWVGVNRCPKTNKGVFEEYMNNNLQCLVQVDKASEGFDAPRASVLVFLHLIKSNTKLAQQVGRGLRRNYAIQNFEDDKCDILASADTYVAEYVENLIVDLEGQIKKPGKKGGGDDIWIPTLPDVHVVDAEWHKRDFVTPTISSEAKRRYEDIKNAAKKADIEDIPVEKLNLFLLELNMPGEQKKEVAQLFNSESNKLSYWRDKSKGAVNTLANSIVKILCKNKGGNSFEKSMRNDLIKVIHSRWIKQTGLKVSSMTSDEHIKKYEWVQEINNRMAITKAAPAWAIL